MNDLTLKQKTAKGLFWGGISNGGMQLISIVFGIYMARHLSEDDYGLVGMLAIFTGIASIIVESGFSVALTNRQNADHKDYNAVFWFNVFMGLFIYIILFFCAPFIALFFKEAELIPLSRFLFLGFLINAIGIVHYTILFKKLMAKQQALINIISLLFSSIIGVILVVNHFTYWALAIQQVLLITFATILRLIVVPWKPTIQFDFSPLKYLFPFSVKLLLTNIFVVINNNVFVVVFGRFYGKELVGFYNQGQKWMMMCNGIIGGMINYVTQPVLAHVNEDMERKVSILRKLIRFGAFISFPLMLGLAFVGKEFIVIAIGEKWLPSVPFLQLFCIWGSMSFLWALYTNLIYTQGKSNIYMNITITIGLLQLAIITLMYQAGIFPMIIGYIFMYFIGLFIWQYYVNKLIGLQLKDVLKDISPYLGITLFCFAIAWLITRNIQNLYFLLILKIIISGILYIFAMKISNSVMFKESLEFLMSLVKKNL